MKRILLLAALLAIGAVLTLSGCSNLALQCSGTYTGDEVRNAAGR